nr:MAG TPA: tail tape measure [Caudoviricetes sp.]
MQFDNSQFEKSVGKSIKSLEKLKKGLKLDEAAESLNKLQKAGDSFSLSKIADGIENLTYRFSWMGRTVTRTIDGITQKAETMIKALSVDQITAGWSKYADKTGYVQTIMNATGKSIDEVNKYLDKLMWFSDETSYSFVDMTQALGTLTSSGGDINKLIPMLEGMANATAFAGKSAAEFSRTMYNLNQSYSSGYMQYIDWKSVEMAGVGSEQLKQAFIDAGKALGTLTKEGKTKKGTLVSIANFGTTLNEKWADTKVMEKAFGTFSEMTEKAYELIQEGKFDTASDAYAWLATQYTGVGITAAKAAQEAKSFNEAIAATTDAVSSGWMKTFEIIFGNYDEARVMWTDLANWLWDVFASGADARNELLQAWKDIGGRTTMLEGIYSMFEAFNNLLYAIKDAWAEVFPETTADDLMKISNWIKNLGDRIKEAFSYDETETVVDQFTQAITGDRNPLGAFWGELEQGAKGDEVKKLQQKLFDMGYDLGTAGIDGIFGPKTQEALQKFQKDVKIKPSGIFDQKTFDKLGEKINEVFGEHTPIMIGETTENMVVFSSALEKLRNIAKGAFSALRIGWKTIRFMVQAAGQVISVLKPLGDVILVIFEKIAGSITKADEALDENGFMGALERLGAFLAPIRRKIQDFADAILIFFDLGRASDAASDGTKRLLDAFASIKSWVSSLGIAEKFSGAITSIKNAINDAWPVVQGFFETIGTMIGDKVSTGFSIVVDWLSEKIPIAIEAVVNAFKWLSDAIKSLFGIGENENDNPIKETVDGFTAVFYDDGETESKLDKAKAFVQKVKDFFTSIWDTVSGFLGDKFEGLKDVNPLESFMTLIETIGNWFDTQFSKSWDGITEGIGKIGNFLAEHAGILIGAGGILIFFQLLKLVKVAFNVFNELVALKKLEAKAEIAKNTDPNKAAKLILAIAGAILSVARVIKMLGGMDPTSYAKGIFGLVLCVGAIVGLVIAFSILQKKDKNIDFKKIGNMMSQMGFAIGVVAASVFLLGHMSLGQIAKGLLAVGGILALMIGTVRIFQKMNVKLGHGFNMKGILELAGAIAILAGLAILLGYINFGKFMKGLGMLSLVALLLFACMKMISKASDGAVNIQISGILKISLAIGLIAAMAWILGNADPGKWWRGFARLVAVSGLIFLFVIILAKIGSKTKGNVDIAIKGLIQLSLAIGILAGITWLLGKMNTTELNQGMMALMVIASILGVLIAVAGKFSKDIKMGPIIVLALSLGALALAFSYAISKVKNVKWQTMIAFAGSMALALGALLAATYFAGKFNTPVGSIKLVLALAIIIGGLTAIVAALGKIDELTNGGLTDALEQGVVVLGIIGDALEELGRAVGRLIGGIIAGFATVTSDAVNELSSAMENFSGAFSTLKDTVSGVADDEELKNDTTSAIDIAKQIKQFFDEVGLETDGINIFSVEKFNGRVDTIVQNLGEFGVGIGQIRQGIGGISAEGNIDADTEKAIHVATQIKEGFFDKIGDEGMEMSIDGLIKYNEHVQSVLTYTSEFSANMGQLRTDIGGMSETDIQADTDTALACAKVIADFLTKINGDEYNIEEENGAFLEFFGKKSETDSLIDRLKTMGENMLSLKTHISGISKDNFDDDINSMMLAYGLVADFINKINGDDFKLGQNGETSIIQQDLNMLGKGIVDFAETTKDVDVGAVSSVANAMSSAMNSVMDVAMPDAAYKASSYIGLFVTVGMNIASGLAEGIRKNTGLAIAATKRVANQMLEAARRTLQVHSPSRKFEKIGLYSDRGWADGISKNSGLIIGSVEDAGTSALDAARGSLSNLASVLMGDMDTDPVIRPVIDMSDVNRSASRINGLVGGSRAMNIDATVRQAQSVAGIMNRNQMNNQNGTNPNGANGSDPTNPVNVSGNNFYIRSDNDVKMLANELATLTRQQQRSLGAAY